MVRSKDDDLIVDLGGAAAIASVRLDCDVDPVENLAELVANDMRAPRKIAALASLCESD